MALRRPYQLNSNIRLWFELCRYSVVWSTNVIFQVNSICLSSCSLCNFLRAQIEDAITSEPPNCLMADTIHPIDSIPLRPISWCEKKSESGAKQSGHKAKRRHLAMTLDERPNRLQIFDILFFFFFLFFLPLFLLLFFIYCNRACTA